MNQTTVHLEDVTRAARLGVAVAVAASTLALIAMLVAGLPAGVAAIVAAVVLIFGCASGGFGLVVGITLRRPRVKRPAPTLRGGSPARLRVPQPR